MFVCTHIRIYIKAGACQASRILSMYKIYKCIFTQNLHMYIHTIMACSGQSWCETTYSQHTNMI